MSYEGLVWRTGSQMGRRHTERKGSSKSRRYRVIQVNSIHLKEHDGLRARLAGTHGLYLGPAPFCLYLNLECCKIATRNYPLNTKVKDTPLHIASANPCHSKIRAPLANSPIHRLRRLGGIMSGNSVLSTRSLGRLQNTSSSEVAGPQFCSKPLFGQNS